MFSTLIAGMSLLIFSTFINTYMSFMLLEEKQNLPNEENC